MIDQTIRKKVLVVDDELGVRRLVSKILSQDYDVLEAANGAEALDIVNNLHPDIVLMDMMMPVMDGLSACCAIKKDPNTKEIPVVMLTAITYDLNKKLAENVAGANAYLTKPFESHQLLNTVSHLLSQDTLNHDNASSDVPNIQQSPV